MSEPKKLYKIVCLHDYRFTHTEEKDKSITVFNSAGDPITVQVPYLVMVGECFKCGRTRVFD